MSEFQKDVTPSRLPWLYEGIWGLLTSVFCVPREAPQLPSVESESVVSRKPSPGFVRYMKLQYWIVIGVLTLIVIVGGLAFVIGTGSPWAVLLVGLAACLLLFAAVIGYLAIYLRYDTTWYVFSDRSMRLRRGLWVIRESTITFENVQNVKVSQGPLERFFGIANLVVETAGGGGAAPEGGPGLSMHAGLIEGVAEAAEIRDSIMSHVRENTSTGLGDEAEPARGLSQWSAEQISVLKEIRDLARSADGSA